MSVADITRLYAFDKQDLIGMRRAAELRALPENWRSHLPERVKKLTLAKPPNLTFASLPGDGLNDLNRLNDLNLPAHPAPVFRM